MEATAPGTEAFANAREAWPIYDTLQISSGLAAPVGVPSYSALAGLEEIPFLTVRNRSEVGLAYTNKESKDTMPFVYYLHSIGVEFRSPGNFAEPSQEPTAEEIGAMNSHRVFEQVLPYHVSAVLKIREDEKLATTVEFTPPGMGVFGSTVGALGGLSQAFSMGWPSLGNRFQFPDPIAVPRNTVVTVTLKLSAYAKTLLSHMLGPLAAIPLVTDPDIKPPTSYPALGNSLIRVTLNGYREVQQRGALHY